MESKKVFTFSSINQTFAPSFAKIESNSSASGLPEECQTVVENGKVVCGRQIQPIDDAYIKSLFGK